MAAESGLGRRYATLWSAFTASNLGDGLTLVGFPLLAITLTDDARLVAVVAACRFLPFLVVGLPAGVLIDRVDRRWLAIVAQLGRAGVIIAVAMLVARAEATIGVLAVAGFIIGMAEVVIDGGIPAVVREVVADDQLETANSRLRASETVTNNFIGPPLGALLFQVDAWLPFALAGLVFSVASLLLVLLPGSYRPDTDPHGDEGFVDQVRRGLRYVWDHPVLRPLALAVAAFSFVGEAGNAVFVILATERLGLSEFQFGLLLAVDAVAAFVMAFGVTALVRRTSHGASMRLAVCCYAAQAIVLGTVTAVPVIVVAVVLGGLSDPTWNVVSATVRQRLVDDHIFGRMMTAYLFIAWSLQPVGALVGGVIAERFGPEWVFMLAAVVVASLLVWARELFSLVSATMRAGDP